MAKQDINLGTGFNTGDGDSLNAGGVKINANFTEVYANLGAPSWQASEDVLTNWLRVESGTLYRSLSDRTTGATFDAGELANWEAVGASGQPVVITAIDLAATANPDEYGVQISWTDGDGNAQTTTDGTPVTIKPAVPGQFAGTAATFAALPTVIGSTTDAIDNGDWAILTAVDGVNATGIYVYDGTNYVFATSVDLTSALEPDITDDTVTDKGIYSPQELHNEFGDKPTFSATVSTGVAIDPDFDVNQEFTLIFDNTSTGDITFNNSSTANLEVAEKVRITISNTDTVARNLVFGSDYQDTDGNGIGTLELPVGTQFRVLEFVRFGASSLVLQSDTLQSAASLEATKIDASAGVVTETLAASTNLGGVRLFTNIDVTNTATLAVQAGETLNGVTDGTFLFSNYSAGTQFRADEVSGGWVVSVVGASTERLNGARFELTSSDINSVWSLSDPADLTFNTSENGQGCVLPFQSTRFSDGWTLVSPNSTEWPDGGASSSHSFANRINDTYMTPDESGLYRFTFPSIDAINSEVNNSSQGSLVSCLAIDGTIVQYIDQNSDGDPQMRVFVQQVNAGQKVQIGLVSANLDAADAFNLVAALNESDTHFSAGADVVHLYVDIEKAQKSEVVLAGMVTPEELVSGRASFAADTVISNTSFADVAGLEVVLPKAGKYRVFLSADWFINSTAGNGGCEQRLFNVTDGVVVPGTTGELWGGSGASDNNGLISFGETEITVTVPTTIRMQVQAIIAAGTVTRTLRGGTESATYIGYQQLPTSTVVMPDALEVEDLNKAVFFIDTVNAAAPKEVTAWTLTSSIGTAPTPAGGQIPLEEGKSYRLEFNYANDTASSTDFFNIRLNGATTIATGGHIGSGSGGMGSYPAVAFHTAAAGDYIEVLSVDSDLGILTVEEVSTKTVTALNPQFTEATDLARSFCTRTSSGLVLTAGQAVTFESEDNQVGSDVVFNGTTQWTLSAGKSYKLSASVVENSASINANFQWYNVTAGTGVGAFSVNASTASYSPQPIAIYEFTPTVDTVVELRSTGSFTVDSGWALVEMLPSTEYVTPGDVPVEDVRVDVIPFLTQTASPTANWTLVPQYADWTAVANEFEYLEFYRVKTGSNATEVFTRIHTAQFLDLITASPTQNTQLAMGIGSTWYYQIGDMAPTGNTVTIRISNGGTDTTGFGVVGVRAQKTVINTTDIPVDDQTASGYFDVGNMRMQWGVSNTGSGPTEALTTLPAPFANTSYSVTATPSNFNGQVTNLGSTKSTTQFGAEGYDTNGANNAHQFNWIALGLKP